MSSSRQSLRVALLGAGYILESHAKALREIPSVELTTVCDVSAARAQQAATRFGIPTVLTSIDELLGSDCDVVHVLLPPHLHFDATSRLLEAGKSVFVEKPLTLDPQQCDALVALAKRTSLRLGVNHNFLFLPAYEQLRRDLHDGRLGVVDHLSVNWLYALPLIQFGPFNNWMLEAPGNIVFELGPHLAAFIVDLLGMPESLHVSAERPIDLPGPHRVYRHWSVTGHSGRVSWSLNLSLSPGQADRSVRIRGYASSAQCDLDRDVYLRQSARSSSALFDNVLSGMHTSRQWAAQTTGNLLRSVKGTLRQSSQSNPFLNSIGRSIATFYSSFDDGIDSRLQGAFGADVIRLCQQIACAAALAPNPSADRPMVQSRAPSRPAVLVVGGTGFIGKRLVKLLVDRGESVRVLTRSAAAAQLELDGLDVELCQGSHQDPVGLVTALDGIDTVYHLAKATGQRWSDYERNDIEPTQALAEASLKAGVKRFIYTGTIDSYDAAYASDTITSDTPLDARIAQRNHYARSKAACETLLMRMYRECGLPVVILRPGIVIGEGAPPAHWGVGMFHSDTQVDYWGDGHHPLPFVLVDDVADALVRAKLVKGIEGQAFLVTDAPLLSARQYVAALEKHAATKIQAKSSRIYALYAKDVIKEAAKHMIHHPNRRRPSHHDWACRALCARFDSAKTVRILGWTPTGTSDALVRQGIHRAVEHYMR